MVARMSAEVSSGAVVTEIVLPAAVAVHSGDVNAHTAKRARMSNGSSDVPSTCWEVLPRRIAVGKVVTTSTGSRAGQQGVVAKPAAPGPTGISWVVRWCVDGRKRDRAEDELAIVDVG